MLRKLRKKLKIPKENAKNHANIMFLCQNFIKFSIFLHSNSNSKNFVLGIERPGTFLPTGVQLDFATVGFTVGTGYQSDNAAPELWPEFIQPSKFVTTQLNTFTFHWSEKVQLGNQGTAYLWSSLDQQTFTLVRTIPIDEAKATGEFTFEKNAVTWRAPNSINYGVLETGRQYSMTWEPAFFTDTAGNAAPELTDKSTLAFLRPTDLLKDGSGWTEAGIFPPTYQVSNVNNAIFKHQQLVLKKNLANKIFGYLARCES